MTSPDTVATTPALAVRNMTKTFGAVRVLTRVNLEVRRGEVHALLGQNGSGKSTLIKCLAGVHTPDHGCEIDVNGVRLPTHYPPSEARRHRLAFVHQDLGLIEDLTVAENLALGEGFERLGPLIHRRRQHRRALEVLDRFGFAIHPAACVRDLSVTARTLVAIARALQSTADSGCLILDEPTAALPDADADTLFSAVLAARAAGMGIVYVTHRLEEVTRIADRATVLRDGRVDSTFDVPGMTTTRLFQEIVGSDHTHTGTTVPSRAGNRRTGAPVLTATNLSGPRVTDASLHVKRGEIVGIAGLAGSGRSELARLLFGAQPVHHGSRHLDGALLPSGKPRASMRHGMAMVPENRRRDGCVLTMSVAENITLGKLPTHGRVFLDRRVERTAVANAINDFDIRPTEPKTVIRSLSGGNQQKAVLAKWLARQPKVLILDEPVQGIDVGAKDEIVTVLRREADRGTAILVIDSDFTNLEQLCDRVYVLRDGRIVDELHGDSLTAQRMSAATFGVTDDEAQPIPLTPEAAQ